MPASLERKGSIRGFWVSRAWRLYPLCLVAVGVMIVLWACGLGPGMGSDPGALAWLGLVSYSLYLLHPALIEVYASVPWTQDENFVPTELLMVALFLLVLCACCALTHRFVEVPMQRQGRRLARRLAGRRADGAEVHEIGEQVSARSS